MRELLLTSLAFLLLACDTRISSLPAPALALDRPPVSHAVEATPTPVTPAVEVSQAAEPAQPITQAPAPQPAPPLAPVARRWRLVGPGLDVPIVGTVGAPCTAPRPPVPAGGAAFDSCQPGLWLDCHVSVCPAMNGWGVGSEVTYFDGDSAGHVYHITGVQYAAVGSSGLVVTGPVHFQVCTTTLGTTARVLSAG